MNILLLHEPTPTGPAKLLAVNADEILRMEEVNGGTTQIIQPDKGPTTVIESLPDILKALGGNVMEVKPTPPAPSPEPPPDEVALPKHGQPIHHRAGAR